ncbi:hypothetical protein ALQ30_200727 [Pseudomonas syringae pv. persicae]|uniref:Uncharacterized protein n=1 Tax=Pseudomonas syringae pv. persicae TaxID=237306 RepID=A0A3M3ZHS7_9PSED|nr:hypothetical protein ALQ30_200727 [Pseudomonas syringae pv. persicae]
MGVPRKSQWPHYHAAMLQPLIGIPQSCTNCPGIWLQRQRYHFIQPLRVDDFDIIIDQAYQLAPGMCHSIVIERRVIELTIIANNSNALKVRERLKIL